ncbi:hypothetical protein HS088_TW03G01260 [Tripterygium wilfordii]|uniref:GST C-terminal domain-containing protein n=1 Tax=Tripterygium wilfordii TaxID=458696 RepID=A0A7J7DX05_TRIWF|nr:hypothetical protein HS088_TW03G01260 [Tripterygium wilfordii]
MKPVARRQVTRSNYVRLNDVEEGVNNMGSQLLNDIGTVTQLSDLGSPSRSQNVSPSANLTLDDGDDEILDAYMSSLEKNINDGNASSAGTANTAAKRGNGYDVVTGNIVAGRGRGVVRGRDGDGHLGTINPWIGTGSMLEITCHGSSFLPRRQLQTFDPQPTTNIGKRTKESARRLRDTNFTLQATTSTSIAVWKLFRTAGEELEQAKKDTLEMLKTIEEHGAGETKFFIGDEIGIVDIAFGAIAYWLEIFEELLGVKLLEAHRFPKLAALINNFKEEPIIKENLPDHHDMFVYFKGRREKILASAS